MFKKTVLENGLKIITEVVGEFKSASIGLWINVGSQYENKANNGISHFVEHLLFKGTKNLSAKDIAEKIDNLGGVLNAFTEKEHTCFYTKVMDRHVEVAMDMLIDMIINPLLAPKDIELEKAVIIDEIRMYEDSPDEMIFELFSKAIWGDSNLGQCVLGSNKVVKGLNRVKITEFIKMNYHPSNIIVSVAGNVDHNSIVKKIKKYFKGIKKQSSQQQVTNFCIKKRKLIKEKQSEQVYLCTGIDAYDQNDEKKYILLVLDSVLGGSLSSRLFQDIREKRGLVYSISTFQNSYVNTGCYGVQASTSADNFDTVMKLVKKNINDIYKNAITKEEMNRSKEHIKGAISLGLENTASRMIRNAKSDFYHDRFVSYKEIIKRIEEVTLNDIKKVAKEILRWNDFSLSVIGPVNKIKSGFLK